MANGWPTPPIYPDPNAFAPGVILRAGAVEYLLETLNYDNAAAGAGPFWQQHWGTLASRTSATEKAVTYNVRVPVISPRHTTLTCAVRMSGNGTTARIKSVTGADAVAFAGPAAGVELSAEQSLTIADGGSGYDEIFLTLQGTGAVACVVEQIIVEIADLTSPLAVGKNGDAHCFGTGVAVGDDMPLPARRGHEIIETLDALYDRPRPLLAWAGLIASAVDSAGAEWLPEHGIRHFNPSPGRPGGNVETSVHARTLGVAGGSIYFDLPARTMDVAAAQALGWQTLTDSRFGGGATIESTDGRIRLVPTQVLDADTGDPPKQADVKIGALSVWGP